MGVVLILLLLACHEPGDSGPKVADTTTTDSATTDSATTDSATSNSATPDSAITDSATTDSATTDTDPGGTTVDWSLGALAPYADRVPVDWSDQAWWADAVDSQAELVAAGWAVVELDATDCDADTTDPKDEDEAAIAATFADRCPSGDCGNTLFLLQPSCQYDTISSGYGAGDTNSLDLRYDNFAILGGDPSDPTSTRWFCNNPSAGPDVGVGSACFELSDHWGQGTLGSTLYAWTGGTTRGDTTIALASCSGIAAPVSVTLTADNEDGLRLTYATRITAIDASCNAELETPLPMTFATPIGLQLWSLRIRNVILMDFWLGFAEAERGDQSSDAGSSTYGGTVIRAHGVERMLVQNMRLGPYVQTGIDSRNVLQVVVRHNFVDECLMCAARDTRSGFFGGSGMSGQQAMYDNAFATGAARMSGFDGEGALFYYVAFNYQDADQERPAPFSGSYCGGERGFFFHADPSQEGVAATLIEGNDTTCSLFIDTNQVGRHTTIFRNRWDRRTSAGGYSGTFESNTASYDHEYESAFANRSAYVTVTGAAELHNLGRWNTALAGLTTPTAEGSDWDETNLVDGSGNANPACPLELPTSLAIRTTSAPWWWCEESGAWNGTELGACDGGEAVELPAKIRAEGRTCTPVTLEEP